jgi:hypothetical protein
MRSMIVSGGSVYVSMSTASGAAEAVCLPKLVGGVRRGRAGVALLETGIGWGVGAISVEMDVEGGGIDNAINRVGDSAAVMSVLTRRSGRG